MPNTDHMKATLEEFAERRPEIVFEWQDTETEAEGWVVLNSLKGGAAGGGTRMRKGLDKHEVTSLAKTMEIKFTVAGPPIGGAKSGINFDPQDPRKEGVLKRWYQALLPILQSYYGTGGDLNVDEMKEVIPITREFGLGHPQEGVLVGHFQPDSREKEQKIHQLKEGVSKVITDPQFTPDPPKNFSVADLITGYGVAKATEHYFDVFNDSLQGKKVIIQGWGNVSSAAAYYIANNGGLITGIVDREGGIIRPEGLDFETVKHLYLNKQHNQLNREDIEMDYGEVQGKIWDLESDALIPGAASRLLHKDQLERLKAKGLKTIVCGANVPFADREIFYGPVAEYADQNFNIIPDFIANLGMARVFAFLMQSGIDLTDEAIFGDVSQIIHQAISDIHEQNPEGPELMKTAYNIALAKVV